MSQKIKLSEAKTLYKLYNDDKRPLLIKGLQDEATAAGGDPTLVVESKKGWISLDDLKTYIATIESYGNQCDIEAADIGFDIYYGAYPNDHSDFANQLTTLFVPTVKNEQGVKEDVVFVNDGTSTSIQKVKDVTDIDIANEKASILNRIGQNPPPKADTCLDTLIKNVN